MSYARTTTTDELTKKQFVVIQRQKQNASNPLLEGGFYYSNEKIPTAGQGEIAVVSQINDKKSITEISFISGSKADYTNSYNDIFNQMIKFYGNEKIFKSAKFKTDVTVFAKDKVYYYAYTTNKVPVIVIANFKIEEDYFK